MPSVVIDDSEGIWVSASRLSDRRVSQWWIGKRNLVPVEYAGERSLEEWEIDGLPTNRPERQARTFNFSSWTSPDAAINPQGGAPMARPIAMGGLVETVTRWHYKADGKPLSREDATLLDVAINAVR